MEENLYYDDFCKNKIDLHNKVYAALGDLPKEQWMDIYDDNHCPNCHAKGYITSKHQIQRMCRECQNLVCMMCFPKENWEDEEGERCICNKCSKKELNTT